MPGLNGRDNTYRSNLEINDLITTPPSWLLRSGITMVAIVVVSILSATYFIQYPDKVEGVGMLTSAQPPIEIISTSNGYIELFEKQNNDFVKEGETLLQIHNSTNTNEINTLENWIKEYSNIENPKAYLELAFPADLQLGAIQSDYAQLELKFSELKQNLKNGMVFKQIANVKDEISKIRSLQMSQERERKIFWNELQLTKGNHERNVKLHTEGVISDREVEESSAVLLQKERQFEGMTNAIIQNNIKVEQLDLQILELQSGRGDLITSCQFKISESIARIKSTVQNWKQTYTIKAPLGGKINYIANLNEKSSIKQGEIIAYIIPDGSEGKYISAKLPVRSIGKIEQGHKAILKFDAYPYKEFGIVTSEVASISAMPEIGKDQTLMYELKIPLGDTIITNYDTEIQYKPNMTSFVEVITEEKSILERLFKQFLSLI